MQPIRRVLFKLSGEALSGASGELYDTDFVDRVAAVIADCAHAGYEIALVIGAGNIWRGRQGTGMDRVTADRMGMLATGVSSLCMKDALERAGAAVSVMTAVPMSPFAEVYSSDKAREYLSAGRVVILGAGLGLPFLSTDTAGAVRAAEIGADAMFMAKNVDYIYTADPRTDPSATRLEHVSCSEMLARGLKAIDATAAAFCLSSGMPIRVFGLRRPEDIGRALRGEVEGTVVTPD